MPEKNAFRKEMVTVIVVKLIAIFLLWGLFFSHPLTHRFTKEDLAKHFSEQGSGVG